MVRITNKVRSFIITDQDPCFEHVMTILLGYPAFVVTSHALQAKGCALLELPDPTFENQTFPIAAINRQEVYAIKYVQLFQKVTKHQPIKEVTIEVYEKPTIKSTSGYVSVSHDETFNFIFHLISNAYLSFYEKLLPQITQAYGSENKKWPNELRFAGVIRNAYAHNGKIEIRNSTDIPVEWKDLKYSYTDNGKPIKEDFNVVEIIDLMLMISNFLKKNI